MSCHEVGAPAPVDNEEQRPGRDGPILLFDGVCNFCNASVNFVIDRDPYRKIRFAPLQSKAGRRLLEEFGLSTKDFDTVVLIVGNRYYTKSSAALRVTRLLWGAWPLLFVFILLPPPIRNFFYDLFAKHRYQWFGKTESCRVPTPELRQRFLEEL